MVVVHKYLTNITISNHCISHTTILIAINIGIIRIWKRPQPHPQPIEYNSQAFSRILQLEFPIFEIQRVKFAY